jgi:hypothetical protein
MKMGFQLERDIYGTKTREDNESPAHKKSDCAKGIREGLSMLKEELKNEEEEEEGETGEREKRGDEVIFQERANNPIPNHQGDGASDLCQPSTGPRRPKRREKDQDIEWRMDFRADQDAFSTA